MAPETPSDRRWRLRFAAAPSDLPAQFAAALAASDLGRLGATASQWSLSGDEAACTIRCSLDEAIDDCAPQLLSQLHTTAPLTAVDLGGGWQPFVEVALLADDGALDDAGDSEGLTLVPVDEPRRAPPPDPPEAMIARYVFDDLVVCAPDGRYLAFVRDEQRCHFHQLHILDGEQRREVALPRIFDYPKLAWSDDGTRLLVGGPTDVLEIDLTAGRATTLIHDADEAGLDVCYLGPRRVAAVGYRNLTLLTAADDGPRELRQIALAGGRLVRPVLAGRLLFVGSEGGTAALAVDGNTVRLLARDWRSVADVWQVGERILCAPAAGGVCEVVGLGGRLDAALAEGDDPSLTLLD